MGADRWPVEFRYISSRLVRQIVQQDEATRSRWSLSGASVLRGLFSFSRGPIDRTNEFALCREATEAVKENTSTISQSWGTYIRAELDLTMGLMTVLMGWEGRSHVEIAVMKAEVIDPEAGRVLIALFGSASNYRGRKPTDDDLTEIPSDVDGLYGILERTREPGDPEIENEYLDRDIGQSPNNRADTVLRLLRDRFRGFGQDRLDVLLQCFAVDDKTKPYDLVIVGAPVWVATPSPTPM